MGVPGDVLGANAPVPKPTPTPTPKPAARQLSMSAFLSGYLPQTSDGSMMNQHAITFCLAVCQGALLEVAFGPKYGEKLYQKEHCPLPEGGVGGGGANSMCAISLAVYNIIMCAWRDISSVRDDEGGGESTPG